LNSSLRNVSFPHLSELLVYYIQIFHQKAHNIVIYDIRYDISVETC